LRSRCPTRLPLFSRTGIGDGCSVESGDMGRLTGLYGTAGALAILESSDQDRSLLSEFGGIALAEDTAGGGVISDQEDSGM